MKVQSINMANQPAFGAKIGAKTLQRLTYDTGASQESKRVLKNMLDEFQKLGSKNSVVEFCPVIKEVTTDYNYGSEANGYQDEGYYNIVNYYLPMTITNGLFPNASYSTDIRIPGEKPTFEALSGAILSTDEWSDGTTSWLRPIIKLGEINLFSNFLESLKKENKNILFTEEANKMKEVLKVHFDPDQAHSMVECAQKMDHEALSKDIKSNAEKINKLKAQLALAETENKCLQEKAQKVNSMKKETDEFIDSAQKSDSELLFEQYT